MNKIMTVISIASVGLLSACGRPDAVTQQPGATLDLAVFTETAPVGSVTPIPEARQRYQPGDEVVLEGLIMGAPSPFVEGRAMFVLGDQTTLTHCRALGHGCPRPWDLCCEPVAKRQAGTASIQVVDDDGNVLPIGLKGSNGLTELSHVKVVGTVARMSTPESFIVNAESIFVMPDQEPVHDPST